jgi:hypothetical protein
VINFLVLTLFVASAAFSYAECIPASGSTKIEAFAAIRDVANQGDAGSELRIEESGSRVTAMLRDYLGGGRLIKTQLEGTLTQTETGACKLHLSGKNKDGQVEIDGEITITRFLGTATRHLGKNVWSHAISLRRQPPAGAPEDGLVAARSANKLISQ